MPDLRPRAPDQRAPARAADARSILETLGARHHVPVVIPRTTVAGLMRLCSRKEESEAKADTRAFMLENGYPINEQARTAFAAGEEWALELSTRMLQKAVRNPTNTELELASIDEWRECDDQQILALHARYQDLVTELDPLGASALTETQLAALTLAAKKKDPDLLMQFGSRLLALFAITSASQPASSETPTSTSGE